MTDALPPDLVARLMALRPAPSPMLTRAVGARGATTLFSAGRGSDASDGVEEANSHPLGIWPADDGMAEERAAILQHDGGWPREEAEALAVRMAAMVARCAEPVEWAALDREMRECERRRS